MPKSMLVACLALLVGSSLMSGKEQTAAPQQDRLAPLAYLVGGTWTAAGEIPGFGAYTAERSYRWILGQTFIEQRHVMRVAGQELATRGLLGWDPERQTLAAWGFGDDGGIATTHAEILGADRLRFEGVRTGAVNAGPIRATFDKLGDDEFLESAESKQGDEWVPMFTFRFERSAGAAPDPEAERAAVLATMDSWTRGWETGDAELAVRDYADDVDWTNAFGDRFQGKAALTEGLAFIFGLDFVMAGDSGGHTSDDVQFLAPDVALIRSELVRTGQGTGTGAVMADRHINHLRVLHKRDGRWVIVSHMISQAKEKGSR